MFHAFLNVGNCGNKSQQWYLLWAVPALENALGGPSIGDFCGKFQNNVEGSRIDHCCGKS
jgi:hypothetical protein